ncbi:hypothetical protein Cs7R123_51950 [Catellatospora sp. TT07R-123]|uniref:DUF6000 family protein n=1 Tax=Catellatospora sp. TT07R-123 TaxID=2733863 RepID=UPI001B237603|nr:DUF6000 family protein [Catellatospora sp. TT07R-123]GHJ47853.1 hypothetical protein Cs7R123_51950 [Catellatospora sp. TT07R-123]
MTESPDAYVRTRRYVMGAESTRGRYFKLLGGGTFADLPREQRSRFVADLCRDARTVDDADLTDMLSLPNWRPRLTAAWLIGIDRRTGFRDRLAELLLASELAFAGKGYAYALLRFGRPEDAVVLSAYLDRYLPRLDCPYDQGYVMSALLHLDDTRGTTAAARFLVPGGPWKSRYGDADPGAMCDRIRHAEQLIQAEQVRTAGVTLVEHFVLEWSDGGTHLAGLVTEWVRDGEPDLPHAISLLADAVASLGRRGLIEVYADGPVPTDQIGPLVADPSRWSPDAPADHAVAVSLTEAGAAFL